MSCILEASKTEAPVEKKAVQKGENPRILDMSEELSNMLKSLSHQQEKVFIYKNERVAGKTLRTNATTRHHKNRPKNSEK